MSEYQDSETAVILAAEALIRDADYGRDDDHGLPCWGAVNQLREALKRHNLARAAQGFGPL